MDDDEREDGDERERSESEERPRDHPEPEDDDTATETARRLEREIKELRAEFEAFEEDIEDRTVNREEVENDLREYVRTRIRRGHARGWGPYLVLLYGTAMTIGAFVELSGGWAILAMLVIWLSTLGLYTFMVVTGVLFSLVGLPGKVLDAVRDFRS